MKIVNSNQYSVISRRALTPVLRLKRPVMLYVFKNGKTKLNFMGVVIARQGKFSTQEMAKIAAMVEPALIKPEQMN